MTAGRALRILLILAGAAHLLPLAPAHADPTVEAYLQRGAGHLQQAEQLRRQGRREEARTQAREAEQFFQAALDHAPDEPRAALLGGQAAVFAGDLEAARRWIERYRLLSTQGDRDPQLLLLMALTEVEVAGRPAVALGHLRRMQALAPRVAATQRDLLMYQSLDAYAYELAHVEGFEEATRLYRAAQVVARRLGHGRKLMAARINEAIMLQRASRHEEAQALYEALRQEEPSNPVWTMSVAVCLGDQNRFEEAIPLYRKVIAMGIPEEARAEDVLSLRRAWLRLGNCYRLVAGRSPEPTLAARLAREAQKAFETYIDLAPGDPLGYRWLGALLYEQIDDPYAAEPHLRRAHALDPLCADSLRSLIQIHSKYPPPGEPTEEARAAWAAPLEAWQRELDEGVEMRKRALEARERENGVDGCS